MTGGYYDIPGNEAKVIKARRFFQSRLGWSDVHDRIVVKGEDPDFFSRGRMAALMEMGGARRDEAHEGSGEDDWIEMEDNM